MSQLEHLKSRGVLPHHEILEIGFGDFSLGLDLIKYLDRGKYTGIDVLGENCNAAWAMIGKHQLSEQNPRVINSGLFGEHELRNETFDFIVCLDLVPRLAKDMQDYCHQAVAKRLKQNGVCL